MDALFNGLPAPRTAEGVTRYTFIGSIDRRMAQGMTESEAIDDVVALIIRKTGLTTHVLLEAADLPYHITFDDHEWCFDPACHDRYFRNAIRWDDTAPNKCRCDMPSARIIHMDRIREARDAELVKLDVAYLKALETRDTVEQDRIANLKQVLRDIPQTFNLSTAKTPETLKSRWPEIIPR